MVPKSLTSEDVKVRAEEEPDDVDLPSISPRPPPTWHPKKSHMAWLSKAANREWSLEERKKVVDTFHGEEVYDKDLLPVKMPQKLYKALKSPVTKKRDYLFNRHEVEKNLYYASSDICAAIRPLLEALSLLDDRCDCSSEKNLIGQGIMGMLSANIRISRGRREVARRFVRLDCSDALFSVPPSNQCLFGGTSDSVKKAQDVTKTDGSLVRPPVTKKSFGSRFFLGQSRLRGVGRGYQSNRRPSYTSQYKSPPQYQPKSKSRRGSSRGGRRGSKSSAKKTST